MSSPREGVEVVGFPEIHAVIRDWFRGMSPDEIMKKWQEVQEQELNTEDIAEWFWLELREKVKAKSRPAEVFPACPVDEPCEPEARQTTQEPMDGGD